MCSIFAVFMLALLYPSINGTTNESSHDVIEYLKTVKTTDCLESLHDVEQYVKSDPYNIESINNGFFPPNQRPSFWVTVNYYFNTSDNGIPIHPESFEAQYNCSEYCDNCSRLYCDLVPDFQFYWAESPLLHFVDPFTMEVLKDIFHINANEAVDDTMIHIVIPPICGDIPMKIISMLNTLTTKVKQFSSVESKNKNLGISKIIPPHNDSSHDQTWKTSIQRFNDLQTEDITFYVSISQYLFCCSTVCFVPVFLLKYFGLVTNSNTVATNDEHPMFSQFWGFLIVFSSYIMKDYVNEFYSYVIKLYRFDFGHYDNIYNTTIFRFPAPSVMFLVGNFISALIQTNNRQHSRKNYWLYICISVITSLCVQRVAFYIGWLAFSVIASPTIFAELSGQILFLIAASVCLAALIDMYTAKSRKNNFGILGGVILNFLGILFIITAYQVVISTVGVDYEDGILAIMPTLAMGFISWVVSKLRVSDIWNHITNE